MGERKAILRDEEKRWKRVQRVIEGGAGEKQTAAQEQISNKVELE
jgi:hypothetical protein